MGMSLELTVLAAASLWGFLQLVAAAQAANAQYGLKWAASPRDTEMPPLTPLTGRINRNFRCQSAFKFDPVSASNFDPFERRVLTVALASSELAGVAETWRARVA